MWFALKMSQLPPPNFGNVPGHFNMHGFPAWPMHNQRTTPSIFGRPQVPSLGFPPRLPINAFPYSPVPQFRPGIWPNMNHFAHHAASTPTTSHHRSPSQHQPQPTNFQVIMMHKMVKVDFFCCVNCMSGFTYINKIRSDV